MFITHDLATVKAIADEVVVMKDGRVVEQGPKAEMFAPPHDPYTELLLVLGAGDGPRLARPAARAAGPAMTAAGRVTDPEVLAFIARTEAAYPAEANLAAAAENRRYYDAMCALFRAPRPAGVTVTDTVIAGVASRRYMPAPEAAERPFMLYSHGGGYMLGSLDSHDDICAEIAARGGLEVVATDYRLAPEHIYPAQLDDVSAVWLALTASGRPGLVAGDSAGGNLSAALCLRMRRLGAAMPIGQALVYPSLGGDKTAPSYSENAEAPLLRTSDLTHYALSYTGGDPSAHAGDPELSPLRATDFSGLPPALVVTADVDPLRDDGPAYVAALRGAGVEAQWRNELTTRPRLPARAPCQSAGGGELRGDLRLDRRAAAGWREAVAGFRCAPTLPRWICSFQGHSVARQSALATAADLQRSCPSLQGHSRGSPTPPPSNLAPYRSSAPVRREPYDTPLGPPHRPAQTRPPDGPRRPRDRLDRPRRDRPDLARKPRRGSHGHLAKSWFRTGLTTSGTSCAPTGRRGHTRSG